jgi:MFS superfamily sulfate permease-like transporter
MTKTDHNRQQEIFGVTVANIMSGVCGGLPATAALARTR